MNEKIQERNQNFLKRNAGSTLEENSRYLISLRKEKRMSHIYEKRRIPHNTSSLKSLIPLLSSSSMSIESFQSSLNRCKEIIQSSSEHSDFLNSLEFIYEGLTKKSESFPYNSFFDDQIVNIFKHLISQKENKEVTNIVLNTLVNTFAKSDATALKFLQVGIIDILINISKISSDATHKNTAVLAIGNLHSNNSQEMTNYFIVIKYWETLLEFIIINDPELTSNSLWCLSFMYRSPNNPSSEISNQILKKTLVLIKSKDFSILKELLWLFHYLTRNDPYVIHQFVKYNLLNPLLSIIGISQADLVTPAYCILNNIMKFSKSYTKVMIDLGFASKFSVSFESRGSSFQTNSLKTYAEMLGRGLKIVKILVAGDTFLKFLAQINANVTANNAVLNGILYMVKLKNIEVNQFLLHIDITKLIISGDCDRDNEGLHKIIKILIEIFEFYSSCEMNNYQTLIEYFLVGGGVDFIEKLSDSKVLPIKNDSLAFLQAFYGNQQHDLLKETNQFSFS